MEKGTVASDCDATALPFEFEVTLAGLELARSGSLFDAWIPLAVESLAAPFDAAGG